MDVERNSDSSVIRRTESPNLQTIPMSGQNELHCSSSGRRPSSRFRGLLWLKSRKWGARISFKYKPYWLGTYETEEEAAMAYDRAAIKLQRSDVPLNFSTVLYAAQETRFMGQHSSEEILSMIKDKTYVSKFTLYLANQFIAKERRAAARSRANRQDISCRLLYQKELRQADLINIKGFQIPKEYAIRYFPQLNNTISGRDAENGSKSTELTFYDKFCCPWTFRYSYWESTHTFVLTKGWKHFLNMNDLKPGDVICFYKCKPKEQGDGRVFYTIDVQHQRVQSHAVGGNAALEMDVEGMQEDETAKGVMLFGVQIGKKPPNH